MKKMKYAPIAIVCLIVLLLPTVICLCSCSQADDTVSTDSKEPIGYALIYHTDGEERVDFVTVRFWSNAQYKIIKADGSYIITQYAVLYFYP